MSQYIRSNNGHSNGGPVLVERRSYGNLPPRSLEGWLSDLTSGVKKVFKGASDVYQSGKAAPDAGAPPTAPAPTPAPAGSGMGQYAMPLAIGGAALVGYLLLRKKR